MARGSLMLVQIAHHLIDVFGNRLKGILQKDTNGFTKKKDTASGQGYAPCGLGWFE